MTLTEKIFNLLPVSDYNADTKLYIGGNKECRWPKCGVLFTGCCINPYKVKADAIKKSPDGFDIAKVTHSRGIWANFDTWVADSGTHYFLHIGNNNWQKINLNDYLGPNAVYSGKNPTDVITETTTQSDIEERKQGKTGIILIIAGIAVAVLVAVLILWRK